VQLELPIVLNPSESIARYPVFAFLRYVSIHLGTFCDSSAISSGGTPIRIIRIRDGSADQQNRVFFEELGQSVAESTQGLMPFAGGCQ
jgi:hypothetical protein